MREAYSLLRQSIIHVEQDDINFDEEENEISNGVPNGHTRAIEGEDESMDTADLAALEAAELSHAQRTSTGVNGESSAAPQAVPSAGKKKMRITCAYMPLTSVLEIN